MIIPKLGVNAPIEVRGIGPDGASEVPNDPADVAWYNFSDRPGATGIALFAGHRDWWGVGPTVFYKLNLLVVGDLIQVRSGDGVLRSYRVAAGTLMDPSTRVGDLLVGTAASIVVYTCDGDFDPAKAEYTRRYVVRAEPVPA